MAWSFFLGMTKQSLFIPLIITLACTKHVLGCYTSIISFGDSITDTGNLLLSYQGHRTDNTFFPPYGETYFHRPTGRCSDGRLILDFIAESLGLPLVEPYLRVQSESPPNYRNGVNFAVVGATAIDHDFFEKRGIDIQITNSSLGSQLAWFKQMLPSLCHSSSSCNEVFQSSLFLMGEIGGNDYNHAFFQGRSFEEIQSFVPLVMKVIASAINELVELGATTLVVPGNFPIGCMPAYLTLFEGSNKEDYDPITGCLNWLNKFSEYHNEQLQKELNQIRELHPHANIIYADYYNAMMEFVRSPSKFGFVERVLTACCGRGGPYNYNPRVLCGIKVRASCNGLLCCSSIPEMGVYYVCNPMTREYKLLPKSRERPVTRFYPDGEATLVGLACNLSTQKFNVVLAGYHRSFGHRPDKTFNCLVYDSESNKWRKFVSIQDDQFTHMNRNQVVFVNGALHWLTESCSCILVLDLNCDLWRKMVLPDEVSNGSGNRVYLLELDRFVSVIQISEAWMNIWVLKDYEKEEWLVVDRVSLRCIRALVPGIFPICQTGEYVFLATHKQVLVYQRNSRVWKEAYSVQSSSTLPLWFSAHAFQGTIFSCH